MARLNTENDSQSATGEEGSARPERLDENLQQLKDIIQNFKKNRKPTHYDRI